MERITQTHAGGLLIRSCMPSAPSRRAGKADAARRGRASIMVPSIDVATQPFAARLSRPSDTQTL